MAAKDKTALQTPATEHIGLNSPFARDGRTHFARFAVIDDAAYNGRDQRDRDRVLPFALSDRSLDSPQRPRVRLLT